MARAVQASTGAETASGGGHRAAKRALELIELVAVSAEPVSLSELARQLGVPKSSAHALARTLDDEGYLERDERGAYSLGPRLLRLLGRLPHRLELPPVARPIMQELVDELKETAVLGVRQGSEIVYVDQVEAPQFIRYAAPLGEPRPLHATSIGKLHLAFMPEAEARALLSDASLDRFTPSTKTAVKSILSELDEVRETLIATNREESMAGVAGIAAPVFEGGDQGRIVAGLSLTGPADRVTPLMQSFRMPLLDAARRIGEGVKPG